MSDKFPVPATDSCKLIRELAALARVPIGLFKRIVLVLDVDEMPTLYGQIYLPKDVGLSNVDPTTQIRVVKVYDKPTVTDECKVLFVPEPTMLPPVSVEPVIPESEDFRTYE